MSFYKDQPGLLLPPPGAGLPKKIPDFLRCPWCARRGPSKDWVICYSCGVRCCQYCVSYNQMECKNINHWN